MLAGSQVKDRKLVAKKNIPANYNYTAKDRFDRQRKALTEAGGARVEAYLSAEEVAKLDALIETGVAGSRRAAVKYQVSLLPSPGKRK